MYRSVNCDECNHAFEQYFAETVLRMTCPTCYRALKLAQIGVRQGLRLEEVIVGLFTMWAIYKVVKIKI